MSHALLSFSLENWGDVNRQNFTAVLTPQMTTQYYFVPFQQAAKVVKSFMCARGDGRSLGGASHLPTLSCPGARTTQ